MVEKGEFFPTMRECRRAALTLLKKVSRCRKILLNAVEKYQYIVISVEIIRRGSEKTSLFFVQCVQKYEQNFIFYFCEKSRINPCIIMGVEI